MAVKAEQAASRLLERSRGARLASLTPLASGANSTVYRAACQDGSMLVVKRYGPNVPGRQDRLQNEFRSFQFLWSHGVRVIPEPIAYDNELRIAIYSLLPGRHLASEEISESNVRQACTFLADLQTLRGVEGSDQIPRASEACFSLGEHLSVVQSRLRTLQTQLASHRAHRQLCADARAFVEGKCAQRLDAVADFLRQTAPTLMDSEIGTDERILSPSDFGFNNILCTSDGHCGFIDFEYFGWDDPAKTVADFCLQPDRPLPGALSVRVLDILERCAPAQSWVRAARERVRLLVPLLRIKWSLIMLNGFRQERWDTERLQTQLQRASAFLEAE